MHIHIHIHLASVALCVSNYINNHIEQSIVYRHQLKDRLLEWIKKQDPTVCYLQETHINYKDTYD